MHPYVQWGIIYNSQDLEATQVPTNRWLTKDVVHVSSGLLLGYEKEGNFTICNNVDETRGY